MPPFVRQRRHRTKGFGGNGAKRLAGTGSRGSHINQRRQQDAPLLVRTQKDREKKKIAAGLALDFLEDNMTVMLDHALLSPCLAAQLARFKNLSVVTNGIETAVCSTKTPALKSISAAA